MGARGQAGGSVSACRRGYVCESASLYVGGGECVCVSGGCGVYMCVSLSLCGGVHV